MVDFRHTEETYHVASPGSSLGGSALAELRDRAPAPREQLAIAMT